MSQLYRSSPLRTYLIQSNEDEEHEVAVRSRRKKSPWSMLSDAFPALMQDPARLGRYAATCCQIGLGAYLLYEIWKAASEIVDEFHATTDESLSSSSSSPALVKQTQHVQQVVQFLEQDPADMMAAFSTFSDPYKQRKTRPQGGAGAALPLPPLPLLQLAQKLLAAGLPLRSKPRDADNATAAPPLPSVESLLLDLTRAEAHLLHQCLWTSPDTEGGSNIWNSVAGLDAVKERLMDTLSSIQPAEQRNQDAPSHHHAYSSLFASTPTNGGGYGGSRHAHSSVTTGVLLYGPPGCGKTLLVKALASKARLPCLVVAPSVLLRKYVGETNSQVRSLFALASKLAPCILCVDELDGLFRERSDNEHEVSRDLKTEFLQWLDGMMMGTTTMTTTSSSAPHSRHPILVVGATNRPFDVDSAVLRRLPQSHFVGLPDLNARFQLLTLLLKSVPTASDLDVEQIARRTEGYSPSDLRQVLQTAALSGPMRHPETRGLSTEDIVKALEVISPMPLSDQYRMQLSGFARQSLMPSPFSSSSVTVLDNGASKWETTYGNFYNVGTLEVDSHTFDLLSDIAKEIEKGDPDEVDGTNSEDDGF